MNRYENLKQVTIRYENTFSVAVTCDKMEIYYEDNKPTLSFFKWDTVTQEDVFIGWYSDFLGYDIHYKD